MLENSTSAPMNNNLESEIHPMIENLTSAPMNNNPESEIHPMIENLTSAPMNNNPESAIPTISQPYAPDLPPTLIPSSPLPHWLLAIALLVTLTKRLHQLLRLIAYLLQKQQDSKKK